MTTIREYMSKDHRRCDGLFPAVEETMHQGNADATGEALATFCRGMEQHFAMEERALFPRMEAHTGGRLGPVQVMLGEHEQMRELFDALRAALAGADTDRFLGLCETLLVMMQQHNIKEEQILYPMADHVLGVDVEAALGEMASAGADYITAA